MSDPNSLPSYTSHEARVDTERARQSQDPKKLALFKEQLISVHEAVRKATAKGFIATEYRGELSPEAVAYLQRKEGYRLQSISHALSNLYEISWEKK